MEISRIKVMLKNTLMAPIYTTNKRAKRPIHPLPIGPALEAILWPIKTPSSHIKGPSAPCLLGQPWRLVYGPLTPLFIHKTFRSLAGSITNSHTAICMNKAWSFCNSRARLRVKGRVLVEAAPTVSCII